MGRAAVSGWMALGRFDGDGIGGGAGLDGARRRLDGDGMNIRVGLMALDLDLMLGGGVGLDGARCRLDGDGMATGRAGWALDLVEWLDGWRGAMARHLRV